jgi:uncharacterized membrane protein YgaE (UPF0421/DUF939 family)
MKKKHFIGMIIAILLIIFFIIFHFSGTSYDRYRHWYDTEISKEMNDSLRNLNKKINQKTVTAKDYQNVENSYEELYEKALNKNDKHTYHKHLTVFLKSRVQYYKGFATYFKTKKQMLKANLNNVYDDGNTEYQLFLAELEKFAKENKEKFQYPFDLY